MLLLWFLGAFACRFLGPGWLVFGSPGLWAAWLLWVLGSSPVFPRTTCLCVAFLACFLWAFRVLASFRATLAFVVWVGYSLQWSVAGCSLLKSVKVFLFKFVVLIVGL